MFFPSELSTILVLDRSNAPSWAASALWGRKVLSLLNRKKLDIKVEVQTQSGSSSIVFRWKWNLQLLVFLNGGPGNLRKTLEGRTRNKKSPPIPGFEAEPDFWPKRAALVPSLHYNTAPSLLFCLGN